jgi:hypothetical protein
MEVKDEGHDVSMTMIVDGRLTVHGHANLFLETTLMVGQFTVTTIHGDKYLLPGLSIVVTVNCPTINVVSRNKLACP